MQIKHGRDKIVKYFKPFYAMIFLSLCAQSLNGTAEAKPINNPPQCAVDSSASKPKPNSNKKNEGKGTRDCNGAMQKQDSGKSSPRQVARNFDVTAINIDPLTIDDDDFKRTPPEDWQGLVVTRETFVDGNATWSMWRIKNISRPIGPLWLQLHDNENAPFAGVIYGLRRFGGTAVVVDTGPKDENNNARFNYNINGGRRIDPNRNFWRAGEYTNAILRDLPQSNGLIISIHSNSPGFDGRGSNCGDDNRSGEISILFCNETMNPRPSRTKRFPFDDDDSLAIIAHKNNEPASGAFCSAKLQKADFNIVFENVSRSDGSLSNYSLQLGLKYINIETQDRGSRGAGFADAKRRIIRMVDDVIKYCTDRTY